MSSYPGAVDTFPTHVDNTEFFLAAYVNTIQAAVLAIENTLGVNPQGTFATVVAWLNSLQAAVAAGLTLDAAAGDIHAVGTTAVAGGVGKAADAGHVHVGVTSISYNGGVATSGPVAISGFANPMTTTGDLITGGTAGAAGRLGIGTAYQTLQVNSGATALQWANSPTSILTTIGDLLYASAPNTLARLAAGTSSFVLTSNGPGTAPSWQAGSGVTLDTTAADIAGQTPTSTALAGAIGKAADAGHRHPMSGFMGTAGGTFTGGVTFNAASTLAATLSGSGTAGVLAQMYFLGLWDELQAVTTVSGAYTMDGSHPVLDLTMIGNVTFTFPTTPLPGTGGAYGLTVFLRQDATGSRAVTWPSSSTLKWPGGTAPSLSLAANAVDVLAFVYNGNKALWYGFLSGSGMA